MGCFRERLSYLKIIYINKIELHFSVSNLTNYQNKIELLETWQ